MLAVAVAKGEHQGFTNAFRALIPYGAGTQAATSASVIAAARRVYGNHPAILQALGL